MKKRIISLVLAIVLVCTMCLSASAASYTGLTSANKQATATLNVGANAASASTQCVGATSSMIGTYLEFYYYNTLNEETFKIGAGSTSAAAQPNDIKPAGAIRAFSNHVIDGGDTIGTWRYSMTVHR